MLWPTNVVVTVNGGGQLVVVAAVSVMSASTVMSRKTLDQQPPPLPTPRHHRHRGARLGSKAQCSLGESMAPAFMLSFPDRLHSCLGKQTIYRPLRGGPGHRI